MGIYNPTSYKKKFIINLNNSSVLSKIIDDKNVKVQTHPHEITVEMLPGGSVSLDFGIFSLGAE